MSPKQVLFWGLVSLFVIIVSMFWPNDPEGGEWEEEEDDEVK